MCFAHAAPAAEELNKQLTAGIENSSSSTQKLDPLKQGLLGVVTVTNLGILAVYDWFRPATERVPAKLILETKNLTAAITKLNTNTQRGGSANESVTAAIERRF